MKKLVKIEVTMQDIWKETRPSIQKSKKAYTRKIKHKSKDHGSSNL